MTSLKTAAALWDSIADEADADPAVLALSDEDRKEVSRRVDAYYRNPERAVPVEDALRRIESSLG